MDKIIVIPNFFLIDVKSLNSQNRVKRLMGCFFLGDYLQANINGSNFINLYLRAEVNFEVVL